MRLIDFLGTPKQVRLRFWGYLSLSIYGLVQFDGDREYIRDEKGRFARHAGDLPLIELKGNELGDWSDIKELRQKAKKYAKQYFRDEQDRPICITNHNGNHIILAWSGVKHTIQGGQDFLLRTIPAVPRLLAEAVLTLVDNEKDDDPNVLAVENYEAAIRMDEKTVPVIITVKVDRQGHRYYDHAIKKEDAV